MDLCHCAKPAPEPHDNQGNLVCLNCRMWYVESAWKIDPRVRRAQLEARQFSKEQQDIVDSIINGAEGTEP